MAEPQKSQQALTKVPLHQGGSKRNNAQRMEEQRICFQLRLQGHDFREIAKIASAQLGWPISRQTAFKRTEEEGLLRTQPAKKVLLETELGRLDRILLVTEAVIASSNDAKEVLAACATQLKAQERRSKLLGLDAPEKVEATVRSIDQEDAELEQMVREYQAREAADR